MDVSNPPEYASTIFCFAILQNLPKYSKIRIHSIEYLCKGKNMIILGIDPGFAITGYGFLKMEGNKFKPLDYGVITTTPQQLFSDRLLHIGDELGRLIDMYHPDVMAIEELFFNNNAKTAIIKKLIFFIFLEYLILFSVNFKFLTDQTHQLHIVHFYGVI